MPAISNVLRASGRVGAARRYGATPEKTREAERDLAAAKIAHFAAEVLAAAPPLTAEQRAEIAAIMSRGVR